MAARKGSAQWNGGLKDGGGTVKVGDGVFEGNYSFSSRFEEGDGTNPEELIAAAHASCFAMALSHGLAEAGTPPEELRTSATVTFQPGEGITKIALTVEGRVPGLDEDGFRRAAEDAKQNCPVSQALKGVPEITLDARAAS
jgi:osmotically inducible protein OsmC